MKNIWIIVALFASFSVSAHANSADSHSAQLIQEIKSVKWNWKKRAAQAERMKREIVENNVAGSSRPGEVNCGVSKHQSLAGAAVSAIDI